MHRILSFFLGAALLFTAVDACAQSSTVIPPPSIAAKSYVLLDVVSGQVLVAQNADELREPASLTKLMTAYLTFDALRKKQLLPSQAISVSERAWRSEGSRMFIDPKRTVSVDELLHGVIIQSGNDASVALAEAIAGSEDAFAERMTQEAARLGLKNTRFLNATGLPNPQQHSTASDLAALASAIVRDFPEFYPYYSIREYRYNNITQPNRNRLLWNDPYVDGMKTGFTDAAGYCLVASAKRGPRRLLSVVLGASSDASRANESQKLLNYGFQFYDTVQLYQNGQAVSPLRVWKGAAQTVPAGFVADRYVSLPKGMAQKMKITMEAVEPLVAPVNRGQRVGVVTVVLDDKQLAAFPLVALEDVPSANWFGRAWDSVRLWLK